MADREEKVKGDRLNKMELEGKGREKTLSDKSLEFWVEKEKENWTNR